MRIRDMQRALRAVYKAKEKIQVMNKKYPKIYKDELEKIGRKVIIQWYASYNPIFYNREESLFRVYRIELDGTELIVNFDKSFMDEYISREYNEYIYQNSFKQGYHGGSIHGVTKSGEKHPNDGIPYWKTPFPKFTHWGRPALYTFSPYNRLSYQMKKRVSEITADKQKEYNRIVSKVEKAVNKMLV